LSDHESSAKVASSAVDARRWLALAVILSGIFVTIMDNSIVNVAIPPVLDSRSASGRMASSFPLVGVGMGLFMTPILNVVMSGIHDRHVGSASGVLTTVQRGGNALGVATLEVPFFLTLSGAGSRGLSQTASYVQAFGAVAFCNVLMLLAVVGLLLLLPGKTSGPL
jgi:hypothetical protein